MGWDDVARLSDEGIGWDFSDVCGVDRSSDGLGRPAADSSESLRVVEDIVVGACWTKSDFLGV